VSELYDDPNRQVVRPDESAAWDEGEGGTMHPGPKGEEPDEALTGTTLAASGDYEAMTKDELIALAQSRGISPANATMTKAELIAALDAG
jgi:hypothetical protein